MANLSLRFVNVTITGDRNGDVDVKGYVIREVDGKRAITCLACGLTSHNTNDVAQKYCGHCHRFHED